MDLTGQTAKGSGGLPDALAAAFDGFEAIRAAAREWEDRAPETSGAFLMAAGAAVDGRNAVTAAPSLPCAANGPARAAGTTVAPSGLGVEEAADRLAALARVLSHRLLNAASSASDPDDTARCAQAAAAADEICHLLGQDSDGNDVR